MVARLELGVWLLRQLDGLHQLQFKLSNALWRGHPALDLGRLHDHALDFIDAIKGPLGGFSAHGRCGVEHQLRVLFYVNHNTVAKLPIQNHSTASTPTNKVCTTKHTRKQVTKTNTCFSFNFHLLGWVDLIKRGQCGLQLVVDQLLGQHLVFVLGAQIVLGRVVGHHNVSDDVVQQRAFIGVFVAGLGRHLLHQGH